MSSTTDERLRPSAFARFARLFAPVDPTVMTTVIDAGTDWRIDPEDAGEAPTIWGGLTTHGRSSLTAAMARALRRERALMALRRRRGAAISEVHRLRPSVRGSRLAPAVRMALRSGLLVEMGRGEHDRVIDLVLEAAGSQRSRRVVLRPSVDGSGIAQIMARDGRQVVLRVASADEAGARIERNADALLALEAAAVGQAPRLVGRGVVAGAIWTTEERLAGRLVSRLSPQLIGDAVEFVRTLPRRGTATSLSERLRTMAGHHPDHGPLLTQLEESAHGWPGAAQHGDLWLRNVLVVRRRLSGVVDWETWHPAGIPGTDILHLTAMEQKSRGTASLGDLWFARPWRSDAFIGRARPYWAAMDLDVDDALLEAVGLDWWTAQVVRYQRLGMPPEWIDGNVHRVLDAIGGTR